VNLRALGCLLARRVASRRVVSQVIPVFHAAFRWVAPFLRVSSTIARYVVTHRHSVCVEMLLVEMKTVRCFGSREPLANRRKEIQLEWFHNSGIYRILARQDVFAHEVDCSLRYI